MPNEVHRLPEPDHAEGSTVDVEITSTLPVLSTSTQCTTSVVNAACGSDLKSPSDGGAAHPSPILVNGQWYTVHPIEDGDLVPDEGAEAVNGLAERSFDDPPLELLGHQHDCQPQCSIGELLGPEALSPFEEFPKVTYPDENRDDNHSVGLFNVAGAGRRAKGAVGASLESLPSLAAPRVILNNFDRILRRSPSPLRDKLGKAPRPDITLASREGPPLVAQPIAVEADESVSYADESTLIKIDGDVSDLVTPNSPRPGAADLHDDTFALSSDTTGRVLKLRSVQASLFELPGESRAKGVFCQTSDRFHIASKSGYDDTTGNLRPEYICAVELAKELTRQREFVEKMKSLAVLESKLKKKATDLEQREEVHRISRYAFSLQKRVFRRRRMVSLLRYDAAMKSTHV
ncbi:hypothetical protein FOL47_007046 [Perkinsus chesapeaki]|uniref:Uncharacterized protein n=1 Tax=Perkinsus chesapeaki TaxID=330153 RepID=A0A7J6LN81_PERCH|nr:hypothetical protein FOL47_007046 [Perkinsus chesapeaki]